MKKALFIFTLFFSSLVFCSQQKTVIDIPSYFPENFKLTPSLHIRYLKAALKLGENGKMPETTHDKLMVRLNELEKKSPQKTRHSRRYVKFLATMRRDLWMDPYMMNKEYTERAIRLLPLEDQIPSHEERFGVKHPTQLMYYFPWCEAAKN